MSIVGVELYEEEETVYMVTNNIPCQNDLLNLKSNGWNIFV